MFQLKSRQRCQILPYPAFCSIQASIRLGPPTLGEDNLVYWSTDSHTQLVSSGTGTWTQAACLSSPCMHPLLLLPSFLSHLRPHWPPQLPQHTRYSPISGPLHVLFLTDLKISPLALSLIMPSFLQVSVQMSQPSLKWHTLTHLCLNTYHLPC